MDHSETDRLDDIARRFSKDFGLYSVAKFVPAVMGVVALVVFTRVFPVEAYGRYALAMTFVALFSTLVFGWLKQAILRFEPQLDSAELLGNVLSMLIMSSLFIVLATIAGFVFFRDFFGEFRGFYFATAALVLSQGVFGTFLTLFRARLDSEFVTSYTIIRSILRLVLAIVLAVIVLDNIVGWIWGGAVGAFFCVTIMAYRSDLMRYSPRLQFSILSQFLRYGFPMIGWLLGLSLLNFADRVLIELIRGTSAVGVYSANYTLLRRGLTLAFTPLIQAAHPLVMNTWDGTNQEEVQNLMTDFTRYFLIIGVASMVFAGVISRPLTALLLDAQYHKGYVIFPIIATGVFLWNIAMIGHKGLEVEDRTELMFLGVGGAVVLNVVLNIPLINLYGYVGAAVATLVSFAAYTVFAYIISFRFIQWRLPTRTLLTTAVAGIVMTAPAAVLYFSGAYTLPRILGATALGTVMYPLVLYVLDEFRSNELSAIAEFIGVN
jgi:O-antigen/teichoic acid export membrane protein